MDSQGKGEGHDDGLGRDREEDLADADQVADCRPMSGEATEAENATDGETSEAQGSPPSGNCAHGAAPSGGQLFDFSLTVHFQSFLEAEIVRRKLLPVASGLGAVVHKEIKVNDTDLTICLMADDWNLLQIATATIVTQLYVVVRTMEQYWPSIRRNLCPSMED